MTSWFGEVFGFEEKGYQWTRKQFRLENGGKTLVSIPSGAKFHIGEFECTSVGDLRARLLETEAKSKDFGKLGDITFKNVAADVRNLIQNRKLRGSVFQAASQFNCLEMVGPSVRPEDGITIYKYDRTQGPACAMVCPAATAYRNYVHNGGQGNENQIDGLKEVEKLVGPKKYWEMHNGYSIPINRDSMIDLGERLKTEPGLLEKVRDALKIGVHWDTQVYHRRKNDDEDAHLVAQLFCSACPVAYCKGIKSTHWGPFASVVLEAAYEASIISAALVALKEKRRVKLFLTLLGGGAFGNRRSWIIKAVIRSLQMYQRFPVDVYMVHYGSIMSQARVIEKEYKKPYSAPKKQRMELEDEKKVALLQTRNKGKGEISPHKDKKSSKTGNNATSPSRTKVLSSNPNPNPNPNRFNGPRTKTC
ncbi:hypothetical protein AAMO2058_001443800 [Amorphochlora amoebiformis]